MIRLLEKLCALNGVSGTEDEVREFIKKHASKYTDEFISPTDTSLPFK